MCDADSGCVPKGCSIDQNNRIGCGYFRLNIYQFRQCYQPGKKEDEDEEVAWINCAEDYGCSSECIRVLGSRFRVKCYGKSDCETLARIHDGGANGCREQVNKLASQKKSRTFLRTAYKSVSLKGKQKR
ncbi:Destabilase, partial [Ostertagia ostertagi]